MQKSLFVLVVTLLLSLIVLLAFVQVNHSSMLPSRRGGAQVTDGMPLPPPPPPSKKGQTLNNLTADGIPMPPPPPPKKGQTLNNLTADGIPMPPPPKKTLSIG
jgi:hypothetical protein